MTPDDTRQRTVAELLAEHGDGSGGRRRRRRDADDGPGPPGNGWYAGPDAPGPRDSGVRDPHPPAAPFPPPSGPYGASTARPPTGSAPVAGRPPSGRGERPPPPIDERRRSGPGPTGPREGPARPVPPRGGPVPTGPGPSPAASRTTGSGPLRAVPPSGSGPIRAVPPSESGPLRAVPSNGSGPLRVVPPSDSGPLRAVPPGSGSGPLRAAPRAGAPAPVREPDPRPGPARGGAVLPGSSVLTGSSVRGAGPWPARDVGGPGRREPGVPDPGPSTGAYDPFAFDDDDEPDAGGPVTVVNGDGGPFRPPPTVPRRGPTTRGSDAGVRFDAPRPPTSPEPSGRRAGQRPSGPGGPDPRPGTRPAGPDPRFGAGRPDDGPPSVGPRTADAPAGGRGHGTHPRSWRGDGPPAGSRGGDPVDALGDDATITNGRPVTGPAATGTRGADRAGAGRDGGPDDEPVTEVGANGRRPGGRRRAPGRTGFGFGLRPGRSGRTGPTPAVDGEAVTPPDSAPVASGPPVPAAAPRRPAARRVVEEPTVHRGNPGGHGDVARSRRGPVVRPPGHRHDRPAHDGPVGGPLDDPTTAAFHEPGLDDPGLDGHRPRGRGFDGRVDGSGPDDLDDRHDPDGLDALDDLDDLDDDLDPPSAQAWAGVVAQWLAGAVAGAVLWVAFRYLWRGLPIVALAAALLVTAGLVFAVRQLLDADRRTTAVAVLVGLLLTASPAVLVLLGR